MVSVTIIEMKKELKFYDSLLSVVFREGCSYCGGVIYPKMVDDFKNGRPFNYKNACKLIGTCTESAVAGGSSFCPLDERFQNRIGPHKQYLASLKVPKN